MKRPMPNGGSDIGEKVQELDDAISQYATSLSEVDSKILGLKQRMADLEALSLAATTEATKTAVTDLTERLNRAEGFVGTLNMKHRSEIVTEATAAGKHSMKQELSKVEGRVEHMEKELEFLRGKLSENTLATNTHTEALADLNQKVYKLESRLGNLVTALTTYFAVHSSGIVADLRTM
jgi:chromosome segregation ATPase